MFMVAWSRLLKFTLPKRIVLNPPYFPGEIQLAQLWLVPWNSVAVQGDLLPPLLRVWRCHPPGWYVFHSITGVYISCTEVFDCGEIYTPALSHTIIHLAINAIKIILFNDNANINLPPNAFLLQDDNQVTILTLLCRIFSKQFKFHGSLSGECPNQEQWTGDSTQLIGI